MFSEKKEQGLKGFRSFGLHCVLFAAPALHSCSQQIPIGQDCAKTQSVALIQNGLDEETVLGILPYDNFPEIPTGAIPGGILSVRSPLTDVESKNLGVSADTVRENRCTFVLGTSPRSGTSDYETLIWTSEHCLVPVPGGKLFLSIWMPETRTYEEVEVRTDALDDYSDFEKAISQLPIGAKQKAFEALERGSKRLKQISSDVCTSASALVPVNQNLTVYCVATADIAAYSFSFVDNPSPALKRRLDYILGLMNSAQKSVANFAAKVNLNATPSQIKIGENWPQLAHANSQLKKGLSFAALADQVLQCNSSSLDALCQHSATILAFPKVADKVILATSAGKSPTAALSDKINENLVVMGQLTKVLEQERKTMSYLTINSNWDFVNSRAQLSMKKVLDPLTARGFASFIAQKLDPNNVFNRPSPVVVNGFRVGLLATIPKSSKPFSLMPGDSGTSFSLFGVLPLFMMTSVDGEPTTGGVALRRLPEAAASKSRGAQDGDSASDGASDSASDSASGSASAPSAGTEDRKTAEKDQKQPRTTAQTEVNCLM